MTSNMQAGVGGLRVGVLASIAGLCMLAPTAFAQDASGSINRAPRHGPIVIPQPPIVVKAPPRRHVLGMGQTADLGRIWGIPPEGKVVQQPPIVIYPRPTIPRPYPPVGTPIYDNTRHGDVVIQHPSSGVWVNGAHLDNNWNVGFGLNTGLGYMRNVRRGVATCSDRYGNVTALCDVSGGCCNQSAVFGVNAAAMYDPRLQPGYAPTPSTQPAPAAAPSEPLSDLDAGALALAMDRSKESVSLLRKHMAANPDDFRAMRLLAVALLAERDTDDAAAMMKLAYRSDPALAREPMGDMQMSAKRLRGLVTRAVTAANRDNAASNWLLVSVLMQAEGREAVALSVLAKAKAQGLEASVHDVLAAELGR